MQSQQSHAYGNHRKKTGGFTLVETLVSVLMVSVVLVAISTLLNRSLGAITSGKEYFIASKLAIEGLEYARAKRNNNLIGMATNPNLQWYAGLSGTCAIDATNSQKLSPSSTSICGGGGTLCMNNYGQFTYSGCNAENRLQGNFTRQLRMTRYAEYVVVQATVTWDHSGNPFVLSTILYKTQ